MSAVLSPSSSAPPAAVPGTSRSRAPRAQRRASRHDLAFARDVLAGLAAPRKSVPGHWRFDAVGTALHQAIVRLDACHPTRLEAALLGRASGAIAALAGAGARLVSLADAPAAGVADLCTAIERLGRRTPARSPRRRLLYVPGAISASLPADAATALALRDAAARHDLLVVAASITTGRANRDALDDDHTALAAAFNRRLLARMAIELGADVDPDAFEHETRFDPARQCLETMLVSRAAQRIRLLGRGFALAAGEPVVVERSYCHGLARFDTLARAAGWAHAQLWVDANARFALHVLELD